ncbi:MULTISPECIES: TetR/AcrR family transcriptional regulator [Streptomyces]|uniref:TetR/AcrR family transcriptional regulator n=1 Tax=Streptomyces tendae TaxID=1932 RepID=A0ABX6A0Y1_STRTE|nr:TetR family transcriptional regulator [Streptomyces tendae]QER90283.1 TetR/AcrR family transcriptional regulator [Streptomyces tendae]
MVADDGTGPTSEPLRARIVLAAAGLLESEGLDALSTRAVAARADVPPPTIFRLFGDKDGLLEAVGEYGFETYLKFKGQLSATGDPVQDLRVAWDLHIRFGLVQPAYYTLVYGQARPGRLPRAGRRAVAELQKMMTRVAAAGRLRMSVERATAVMHAAGMGTILTMISAPPETRDLETADAARDVVIAAITTPAAPHAGDGDGRHDTAAAAMALRAALHRDGASALSAAEQPLLIEWLNRLADSRPEGAAPPAG